MPGPDYHAWTHLPDGTDPIDFPIAPAGASYHSPSCITLPVMELKLQGNHISASGIDSWTLNASYAHNGYLAFSTNNSFIAWPTVLGPQGSIWMPIPILARGPDFGIVKLEIGTAEYQDDGNGWPGTFEQYIDVGTWVLLETMDRYAISLQEFPDATQIAQRFQFSGADLAVSTSINVDRELNGGAGPHYIRLRVDGKNASSSGHKMQLSGFTLLRLGNDWLA